MSSEFSFKSAESAESGQQFDLESVLSAIKWDAQGLIPAIAQQHDSGEVLMMAWMNQEALLETLQTQRVCYWSRSRQRFWRKGESSGQVQLLKALHLDCDGDAILLSVDQTGPACHTGRRSCFYHALSTDKDVIDSDPIISPDELYK